MTDDHDAELDTLTAQLFEAGYLVIVERPDGGTDFRLTEEGARVARQLAMSGEDAQDALLAALLGSAEAPT